MAIVGHWASLAEAQKLVQGQLLLSGVIETIIEEGQIIPRLPVMQIDTKEVIYYREKSIPAILSYRSIGDTLTWESDQDYGDKVTLELKIASGQRRLDKFIRDTYKTPNDYRAQKMKEVVKGVTHFMEKEVLYGTGVGNAAKGLAQLIIDCSTTAEVPSDYATTLNINEASALSLANLRALCDSCRPGKPDLLLMNRVFARKFDALVFEHPIDVGTATYNVAPTANISMGRDEMGLPVTYFNGIPIVRSDYITITEDTMQAAATLLPTGGTATSIYAIKFGQIDEGGFGACMGGQGGEIAKFFRVETWDKLEQSDSEGIRVVGYFNFGLGSILSAGRIANITAASAITA